MGTCLAIVLAAGEGTRMLSPQPKVLHQLGGRSLLAHVLGALRAAGPTRTAIVVAPNHAAVEAEARRVIPDAEIYVQAERRGTAHAVLAARPAIERGADHILIIFGDTPLILPQTLRKLRDALTDATAVAVLAFPAADPTGYGRLVMSGGELLAIREQDDADESERAIGLCNGGLMALSGKHALAILSAIGCNNRKREFYLTDAVAVARRMNLRAAAIEVAEDEVMGINTKTQLSQAEAALQKRLRAAVLEAGVTLIASDTVYLSADTKFGKDVVIEPFVVFKPGVVVEDGAVIRSFSHLEGVRIGKGATVGPFARLRAG
ncbi:MAG TPA: NTP transferase domain-containing protein [Xanthobacteraceae bacterium]|nr:NTP transferase domain-containing protein [Xanthobacteraceae bacterium]